MELHRPRQNPLWIGFMFLAGVYSAWASLNGWELRILFVPLGSWALFAFGAAAVLWSAAMLRSALRPTPIVVNELGLRLRVAGLNGLVPWTLIDAVILEPYQGTETEPGGPRLLLVPAAHANLGVRAEHPNMVDGRPSIVLMSLTSIREPGDQVVHAFETYAGPRFVNGVRDSTLDAG